MDTLRLPRRKLDTVDKKIIEILLSDSTKTISEVAAIVGLTYTPCRKRIKGLERNGYIIGYTVKLGKKMELYSTYKYMLVALRQNDKISMQEMVVFLEQSQRVVSIDHIEGEYDMMIKFGFNSEEEFQEFHDSISSHKLLKSKHTLTVIRALKDLSLYYI